MKERHQSWKILDERVQYTTDHCTVIEQTVALPNGTIIDDYSVVRFNDVAMVFPLTSEKEVVMVRQYRHGVGKVLLELPAGTYKKEEETAAEAAGREMQEETGYRNQGDLYFLGRVHDFPTKESHEIDIFLADQLIYDPLAHNEPSEEIEVVKIPLSKIPEHVQRGEIAVGSTFAAIYLATEHLKKTG